MKTFAKYIQESYLSKRDYERRRENASKRNLENIEIAVQNGMTEEQAEAIASLCSARHEFHSNMDSNVRGNGDELKSLYNFNNLFYDYDLPFIKFSKSYEDIDNISLLQDLNDEGIYEEGDDEYLPRDYTHEEYQEWYDRNYERIYDDLEQVNKDVEKYLHEIDKKYKTHFEPTGSQRIF